MILQAFERGGEAVREMKKGSLGLLLLSLLNDRPNYGYALCELLREQSQGALSFEDGAIYPMLHSFEQQGVVEGYWETAPGSDDAASGRKGPRRRYYRLTTHGRSVLQKSLEEWRSFSEGVARIVKTHRIAFA